METILKFLIGLSAFTHCYILWFEMFAWETRGKKVFSHFPGRLFAETKSMAANQGLYNGFLAAGLIWTFFIQDQYWFENVAIFFLSCVSIAGIYGAFTVDKKIFFVQALPALVALIMIFI